MNIWNKVLYVLLFLTSLTFFWLVSQRYLLGKNWETKIAQLDNDLSKAIADNETLFKEIYSDPTNQEINWDSMGLLAQLRRVRELQNGLVWLNCQPGEIGTPSPEGMIEIAMNLPVVYSSQGIMSNSFVYLFDSGEPFVAENNEDNSANSSSSASVDSADLESSFALAKYLGAFKIDFVSGSPDAPTNIKLTSVHSLSNDELDSLKLTFANQNSLIVSVDRLPVDSPSDIVVWNQLNPDFLKSLSQQDSANAEFFAKDQITLDDLQNNNISEKRFPLDFTYLIESKIQSRNYLNLSITQKETAKWEMENVLTSQFVSLFPALFNELSLEDQQTVQAMLQEVNSQLKNPDLSNTIVSLLDSQQIKSKIDNNNQLLAQNDPNSFAAKSYMQRTNELTAENAAMDQYCQQIQQELDLVQTNIKEMKAEIQSLLYKNCQLAKQIAKVQLTAAETILKNSQTVSNDQPLLLNNPI